MTYIEPSTSHTVEVGYDEFCGALAAQDLQALWSMQTRLMPESPIPTTLPWLWKWDYDPSARQARRRDRHHRARRRPAGARVREPGAERPAVHVHHAVGRDAVPRAGESAPAHRHTPSAIRFVMTGSGVYTTVDGDGCDMAPGDLILTPNWAWHDHNNYGEEPMVWFDGLDLPLVATLESIFFENHPDERQQVLGHGISEHRHAAGGLRPAGPASTKTHSPLLRIAYEGVDRTLESLHAAAPDDHLVTVEYIDPETGGPVVPTLSCAMNRAYPGGRSPSHRKAGSSVFVAFRGNGRSIIDGQAFTWGPGDVFVSPSWSVVDHESFETSDLFEISDRAVLAGPAPVPRGAAGRAAGGHRCVHSLGTPG